MGTNAGRENAGKRSHPRIPEETISLEPIVLAVVLVTVVTFPDIMTQLRAAVSSNPFFLCQAINVPIPFYSNLTLGICLAYITVYICCR